MGVSVLALVKDVIAGLSLVPHRQVRFVGTNPILAWPR